MCRRPEFTSETLANIPGGVLAVPTWKTFTVWQAVRGTDGRAPDPGPYGRMFIAAIARPHGAFRPRGAYFIEAL